MWFYHLVLKYIFCLPLTNICLTYVSAFPPLNQWFYWCKSIFPVFRFIRCYHLLLQCFPLHNWLHSLLFLHEEEYSHTNPLLVRRNPRDGALVSKWKGKRGVKYFTTCTMVGYVGIFQTVFFGCASLNEASWQTSEVYFQPHQLGWAWSLFHSEGVQQMASSKILHGPSTAVIKVASSLGVSV